MPAESKTSVKKAKDPCAELKRKLKERDAELKARNAELKVRDAEIKEAREQQTATAEILKVIRSSPTDTQPVFDAILENAMHLCDAHMGHLGLYEGGRYQTVAQRGATAEFAKFLGERGSFRPPPGGFYARMIAERQPIQIADRRDSPEYRDGLPNVVALVELGGARSFFVVPMLKEGRVAGSISIYRPVVQQFTQKQIDLVSTFANQAVIAIENVRLFNETKEALEQQTVISEILRVIGSSPTDTQPVFDAIVKSGVHLFEGLNVTLRLVRGDQIERVASTRPVPDTGDQLIDPLADEGLPASRAIRGCEAVHIPDVLAQDWISSERKTLAERRGFRAIFYAPLLRGSSAIGTISISRATPGPFTAKQIELLKTFANQAVIAIENVRLFKELQTRNAEITEALERQTATSEILSVISQSPTDVAPVFETIMKSAARLCGGPLAAIYRFDGELLHLVETHNWPPDALAELHGRFPTPPDPTLIGGRVILSRSVVQESDALSDPDYDHALARKGKWRRVLGVPLLRDGEPIGVINLAWLDPGETPESQVTLLKTFADQAVIAIENVRLFKELQARNAEITEALEQQTATAEILKVISSSPTDTQPVFEAILENALRLCDGQAGGLTLYDGERLQPIAHRGRTPEFAKWLAENPSIHGSSSGTRRRLVAEQQPIHILDRREYLSYREGNPLAVALVELDGVRTSLTVPMLKEGRLIGAISITRREVRAFTQKQVDLVSTFASQAVIAIENVRLFKELQARNAEVTESLEQQTATAEILKVISSSPTDIQPVFDAILESATRLCDAHMGTLGLYDGEKYTRVAHRSPNPAFGEWALSRVPLVPEPTSALGRMIADREPIHIPDLRESPGYRDRAKLTVMLVEVAGARTLLAVPLLKEGRVVGGIAIYRSEVQPFTQKQIGLVSTFADQAVIAIENVRLFKELQARNAEVTEALEQQTATAEILKVISSSPTDTQPVFEAILDSAMRLCDAHTGGLHLYDGENLRVAATGGRTQEFAKWLAENPSPPASSSGARTRMIAAQQPIHTLDRREDRSYREGDPTAVAVVELNGVRTALSVPMLKEGRLVGMISVNRREVRAFAQKQIDLVCTFASQAMIAIENVRLFKEIQDKSIQLEIASRHKSEFLTSMSHELRTPLNAILGFNEMIIHELYGEVPEGMKVPLEDIQSSGKHLLGLINNVLDLAKIEAGRMELALADYSIMDTAESVRSTLRSLAAEKGLEFVINVPNDMPLVYGDSGRILQCLVNLAGNSLKFTKAGKVEISARHHDGLLTCCVSDTGVGIPPDKIGSLFTEFKQTDATIASEYGGTGLGLSITKKFIEMHGGRIWVESEMGKGSRFIFEIPLRAATQTDTGAQA